MISYYHNTHSLQSGSNAFLFVENNSGLNFKVLRSTGFSAYVMGPGD